ncbi:hypothetical protein AB1N83_012779 [Pleurotus pulmonarius]
MGSKQWFRHFRHFRSGSRFRELRSNGPSISQSRIPWQAGDSELTLTEEFQVRLARTLASSSNGCEEGACSNHGSKDSMQFGDGPELSLEWIAAGFGNAWLWKDEASYSTLLASPATDGESG